MKGVVPESVLMRRDKVAFQTPQRRWIQHLLREGQGAPSSLAASLDAGMIDRRAIRQVPPRFVNSDSGLAVLWRLLCLEMWLQMTRPPIGSAPVGGRFG